MVKDKENKTCEEYNSSTLINPPFGCVPLAVKNSSSYQDRIRKQNISGLRAVSILLPTTGGVPLWNEDMVDQEQLRETMTLPAQEHP